MTGLTGWTGYTGLARILSILFIPSILIFLFLEDEKIIARKGAPKMGEFGDFLPRGFDSALEKIRGK